MSDSNKLSVGDTVIATCRITRHDKRASLSNGDLAKVRSVFQLNEHSPQIVDLILPDGKLMGDIVVNSKELIPIKKQTTP